MTYAEFLLLFLGVPLSGLVLVLRSRLLDRRYLACAGGLTVVALLYMAPWDHTAAVWGLWWWAGGLTWGARWLSVPVEEYLSCALQTLLSVTLVYWLYVYQERAASPGDAREGEG
jgi:lycopene cyclase domain-containing protein